MQSVLCFSGLDPSGGAGIQADIESIKSSGAHACCICTALTTQDSQQVYDFMPVPAALILKQSAYIMEDMNICAFKSGMLASIENIAAVKEIVCQHPHLPYVLDPVLAANSGGSLGNLAALVQAYHSLIPYSTLITPNSLELQKLTGKDTAQQAIDTLFERGARAILVKGEHQKHPHQIPHELWIAGKRVAYSFWPRLEGQFHGSGCTLASHIAGLLAQNINITDAVSMAELYTHHALTNAWQTKRYLLSGKQQAMPKR